MHIYMSLVFASCSRISLSNYVWLGIKGKTRVTLNAQSASRGGTNWVNGRMKSRGEREREREGTEKRRCELILYPNEPFFHLPVFFSLMLCLPCAPAMLKELWYAFMTSKHYFTIARNEKSSESLGRIETRNSSTPLLGF